MTAASFPGQEGARIDDRRDSEMLTLPEACRYLRVPEGTLRYWKADLVLWLAEQASAPQAHR